MKKKLLTVLLCSSMTASLFSGCGSSSSAEDELNAAKEKTKEIESQATNITGDTDNEENTDDTEYELGSASKLEFEDYGADGNTYTISFELDDSFIMDDSGAAEVPYFFYYSPNGEAEEYDGTVPTPNIQFIDVSDETQALVQEYKDTGDISIATDITKRDGIFLFSAKTTFEKIGYSDGDYTIYFYGLDRLGGSWENAIIWIEYPTSIVGTAAEEQLMDVLDQVAETYTEKKN